MWHRREWTSSSSSSMRLQREIGTRATQREQTPRASQLDLGLARKRLDLDAGLVVKGTKVAGGASVDWRQHQFPVAETPH